jgi:hypothetical protein
MKHYIIKQLNNKYEHNSNTSSDIVNSIKRSTYHKNHLDRGYTKRDIGELQRTMVRLDVNQQLSHLGKREPRHQDHHQNSQNQISNYGRGESLATPINLFMMGIN